jgi:hypothetical protein
MEEIVSLADKLVEAGFLEAKFPEERWPVGLRELSNLGLNLCADDNDLGGFFAGDVADLRYILSFRAEMFLVDVTDVHHWLICEEVEFA